MLNITAKNDFLDVLGEILPVFIVLAITTKIFGLTLGLTIPLLNCMVVIVSCLMAVFLIFKQNILQPTKPKPFKWTLFVIPGLIILLLSENTVITLVFLSLMMISYLLIIWAISHE